MSIGHRVEQDEILDTSLSELYDSLGERDTAQLFEETLANYTLDTNCGIPTGAGINLTRTRVYIDSVLYQQAMDNEFKASGLSSEQIIKCWVQHEIIEKTIIDGDNPVDLYSGGHKRALRREHELVTLFGGDPKTYELTIWPGLVKCYQRPVKRPPLDLWCGPILDHPDDRAEEIIEEFQRAGVKDAFKRSKYDAHYGIGAYRCDGCRNWVSDRERVLSPCRVVSGLMRNDRNCDFYIDADETIRSAAKNDEIEKFAHETVQYGPARGEEACRTCKYSDHADKPRCSLVENIRPHGWCRLWSPMN